MRKKYGMGDVDVLLDCTHGFPDQIVFGKDPGAPPLTLSSTRAHVEFDEIEI